MHKFLDFFVNWVLPYLVYLPYIAIGLAVGVIAFIKFVKKLKKAKTTDEALQVVNEFVDDTKKISESESLLQIKEFCRQQIYNKEKLFKNISTTTGVLKTGALKYDSVLKEVELECMRKGVKFYESDWYQYINYEVDKMKEVK